MINIESINNFVFDVDQTLYNNAEAYTMHITALNKMINDYFLNGYDMEQHSLENIHEKYGHKFKWMKEENLLNSDNLKKFKHMFNYLCPLDHSNTHRDKELPEVIKSLNGDKYILTDNSFGNAIRTLNWLGFTPSDFRSIIDIFASDLEGKGNGYAFEKFIDGFQVEPEKTVVFDDSFRVIEQAKYIGFNSVWVDRSENEKDIAKNKEIAEVLEIEYTDDLKTFLKENFSQTR